MSTHIALCSGGMDSTVAAHVATRWGPCDILVYLDTRTGAERNRQYVERLADHLGVQLWTLRTNIDYGERVKANSFPGPSRHPIMYRSLKERQLGKLATVCGGYGNDGDLHLWTGVRQQESRNRMAVVEPVQEVERWTWHAPICYWTKQDCREYIARFSLPINNLWRQLGRSGDCFCGCFGNPSELIDAEAAGCNRLVRYLRELENEVDADDEKGVWGWQALSGNEQRAERAKDRDMTLCSYCGGAG